MQLQDEYLELLAKEGARLRSQADGTQEDEDEGDFEDEDDDDEDDAIFVSREYTETST